MMGRDLIKDALNAAGCTREDALKIAAFLRAAGTSAPNTSWGASDIFFAVDYGGEEGISTWPVADCHNLGELADAVEAAGAS